MTSILTILLAVGNTAITIASGVLATACITYGAYSMWDVNYVERNAFTSQEMAVYRPVEEEGYSLEELQTVNDDAASWVQIADTHIDYPVMHGEDDLYYASHDMFGSDAISGSIYLAAANHSDFSDIYNVLYGHHMDNGAMFGDIDKFADPSFFNSHQIGSIVLGDTLYDLNFFAFMRTNAYDDIVYNVRRYDTNPVSDLTEYIRANAINYRDGSGDKIIALSTCSEAETNGREVLFAYIAPATQKLIIEDEKTPLAGLFHRTNDPWAFLNLLCLIGTICTVFPVPSKLRRLKLLWKAWHEKKPEEPEEEHDDEIDVLDVYEYFDYVAELDMNERKKEKEDKKLQKIKKSARNRSILILLGFLLELIVAIIAVIFFLNTENLFSRITMIDKYTIWMLAFYAVVFAIDAVVFFQKKVKEETRKKEW